MELNNEALFTTITAEQQASAGLVAQLVERPVWQPVGSKKGELWRIERWLLRCHEKRAAEMYDRVQADLSEMEEWLTRWLARDYLAEAIAAREALSVLPPAGKRGGSGKILPTIPVPPPPERPLFPVPPPAPAERLSKVAEARMAAGKENLKKGTASTASALRGALHAPLLSTASIAEDEAFMLSVNTITGATDTHQMLARQAAARIVTTLADNELTTANASRIAEKVGRQLVSHLEIRQMMELVRAERIVKDRKIVKQLDDVEAQGLITTSQKLRAVESALAERDRQKRRVARWEDFFEGKGSDDALAEPFNPNVSE